MAVYDGVPSIRLEGDEERALALIPEAKVLLYKVQSFMNRAEVNTFSMTRRVNDDSTIFVLVANGQNIIHISVAPNIPELINEVPEIEPPVIEANSIDFYSGLVFRGVIEERTRVDPQSGETIRYKVCVAFAPTDDCVAQRSELVTGRQEVARLAVRPWGAFDILDNANRVPVLSQYTKLRSSMYSGTMKKVVQIVMGLGHTKMRSPLGSGADTEYMREIASTGVQVRYDWRFTRTHGITIASDGRLWLVEISQARGVLAMPLPIYPASDTESFRAAAAERHDESMVLALDELGCLPTGEAFPATVAKLNAAIERGDILRLLTASQLSEFYTCSPYSTSLGWAFNGRGNEAHNTAYYYGGEGFQRGVWYQVNVSIGATNLNRQVGQPIAEGHAELRKNTEGFIYTPPVLGYNRYVPIKFHEPMLPGLLSHEGTPSIEAASLPPPRVDVPMFVSFVNDELKLVRFFRNPKQDPTVIIDDPRYPGECMYDGEWVITESFGVRDFPPMMYTNDFDDRRVATESVVTTIITSVAVGFDAPVISDFLEFPRVAHVHREKVYRRTTTVDNKIGEYLVSAVAIPEYSREAYYYATGSGFGEHYGSTSIGYDGLRDPNTAYTWRCFPQGPGGTPPWPPGFGCATDNCGGHCTSGGDGAPKERRVVCLTYEPAGDCSDYADSGAWLSMCQNVDPLINEAPFPRVGSITNWNLGTDEHAKLFLVTPGHNGPIQIPITPGQMVNHWMTPSPDPETSITQFIYATHSAIGNEAVIYSAGLSTYTADVLKYGAFPTNVVSADGFPAFVGVNS